jgi:hypothetical protein
MRKLQKKFARLIAEDLREQKWTLEEIAGYMIAQRTHGILAEARTIWEVKNGMASWAILKPLNRPSEEMASRFRPY